MTSIKRAFSSLALAAAVAGCLGLLLPASFAGAAATCTPPGRSTPQGRAKIRTAQIIAVGTIDASRGVPKDAHGVYSFYFFVQRYLAGSGPNQIEVTNYGNLQLPAGFEKPGSSRANSKDFFDRQHGQVAVFFIAEHDTALGKDRTRYQAEYATNSCLYNVIGTKDSETLVALVQKIFSDGTGGPGVPTVTPTQSHVASGPVGLGHDRGGPITRAALLVIVVGGALGLFAHPRSPLFERWRTTVR